MILIADSGGSKTNWVLIDTTNQKTQYFHSQGLNPKVLTNEAIEAVLRDTLNAIQTEAISNCYFYGAGISDEFNHQKVLSLLKQFLPDAEIFVEHDLLGAARAGLKKQQGNTLILGTGSNSAFYDGNYIVQQVGGYGYLFGDEASGAWFGKQFLTQTCSGCYKDLALSFEQILGLNFVEYRNAVYLSKRPNATLAAVFPWLLAHQNHLLINNLFQEGIREFLRNSIIPHKTGLKTAIIGSVGFFLKQIITEELKSFSIYDVLFIQNPLPELVHFHQISK
ncbi:MAG: hypothetical protein LC115_06395 [Bacteroidia bacterium]|nr:hypothetical protein [Bacteroidia bacterium]